MADSQFLVDPETGKTFEVSNPDKAQALLESGWQTENDDQVVQRVTREAIREMPVAGRVAAGFGQATNQLLLGIPRLIYEHTGSEDEKRQKQAITKAIAEEYPAFNIAGGTAGLAGALLTGPGAAINAFGGRAVKAASTVAKVAGPKASAVLTSKLGQAAIKAGAENVAFNAPYRITEDLLGDLNISSEGLLAGAAKDFGVGSGFGVGASLVGGTIKAAASKAKGIEPAWFKEQANKFQIKQAGLLTSDIRKLEDYTHKMTFPEQIQSFVDDLNEIVPKGQWKGAEHTAQAVQEARKATGAELTKIRAIVDHGAGETVPYKAVEDALNEVKAKYSSGSLKIAATPGEVPSKINLTGEQYQALIQQYGENPAKWPPEVTGGTPGTPGVSVIDPTRSPDLKAINYVQDSFKAAAIRKMEAANTHPERMSVAIQTGQGLPSFKLSELHDIRQAIKDALYHEERVAGIKTSGGNDAFKAIGGVMDDAINRFAAESGNENLINSFATANSRYHKIKQMLKIVEPGAERAIARNKVGLGSTIWTGGGYIAGGNVGALAGLTAGYVKQHYGNFVAQKLFGTAAKVLESIPQDIGKAVNDMLSHRVTATLKASSVGSVGLLSRYAGDEAKDRQQAAKALINDLSYAQSSPETTADVLNQLTGGLADVAPQNFALMGQGVQRANQYLLQEAPKPPAPIFAGGPVPDWTIPDSDLSKWERKVNAVFDPMSFLREIRTGTLTKETVDAVKAVYPNLYAKVQEELARRLAAAPARQVQKIRAKLALVLEPPVNPQLTAQRIQSLQAGFAPNKDKIQPRANTKIDEAGRYTTDINRVLQQ